MARGAQGAREVRVQELLGRRVLAKNGRPIGRIEEIRAEPRGRELMVEEFHLGGYALLERLSASILGRAVLPLFGAAGRRAGYRVRWDQLDLADPARPRLRCTVDELEPLRS